LKGGRPCRPCAFVRRIPADTEPFRYSHLRQLDAWAAAGHDPQDASAALAAWGFVVSSANVALPLAVPGAEVRARRLRRCLSSLTIDLPRTAPHC
jgi:hypothetical protein